MLNFAAMETALVALVRDITGIVQANVIIADQNIPAPISGLYVTVKLGDVAHVSRDQFGPTSTLGERTLHGHREMPISIHAYRKGGREALESIADSLEWDSVAQTLMDANMIIYSIGAIRNLTAPVDNTMRDHYFLELFCRSASETIETIPTGGYIEKAEVTETIEQPPMADFEQTVIIG